MGMTLFLAKFLGLYLLLVGAAMLKNPKHTKAVFKDFFTHKALCMYSGVIALLLGLVLVLLHNVWIADWPVVITLLAWLILIKGVLRLFFPETFLKYAKSILTPEGYLWSCWICILLGGYLSYVGFFLN